VLGTPHRTTNRSLPPSHSSARWPCAECPDSRWALFSHSSRAPNTLSRYPITTLIIPRRRVLDRRVNGARGPPDNSESGDGLSPVNVRRSARSGPALRGARDATIGVEFTARTRRRRRRPRSKRNGRCRHARRLSLPLTLPLNRRETRCYGFTRVGRICTVWPAHASTEGCRPASRTRSARDTTLCVVTLLHPSGRGWTHTPAS
jgi:hypothetical protein